MIKKRLQFFGAVILTTAVAYHSNAQERPLDMKMDFEEYDPPSSLVVEEHHLTRSKFPFIDIHNHYGNMNTGDLSERVKRWTSSTWQSW
jgi:uncharacterized protein